MPNPFNPEYLILHDYGGTPGPNPSFNPYHALVSGGGISYRNPNDPYSQPAPHAFKLNPKSIGLSWGGKVGGMPSKEEFALLKKEYDEIKKRFPNIKVMSHGEAYAQTRGTPYQASKDGRGLEEASWRKFLMGDMPYEPGTVAPQGPLPMNQRSLTAVAGHTQTQPPTTGAAQPMAQYKDVGGQSPVMDPAEVARRQNMAKMLMQSGMNPGPMRHWTQALGAVLQGGAGMYQGKQAEQGLAQGQQSGNEALAAFLQGNDPNAQNAALSNPYSRGDAMDWLMAQKKAELKASTAGSDMPATVQEWEYYNKLTPEDQKRFIDMKRQNQKLIGADIRNLQDGGVTANVGESLAEGERQKKIGAAQGQKEADWPQVDLGYKQSVIQDEFVKEEIDNAVKAANPWTTGFVGSVGKYVSGSPQSDLAFTLQSIEANLAFDKLQAIRDASPTGGALGAVSERELDLLKGAWGAVNQAQSYEQFVQRLNRLKKIKSDFAVLKKEAYLKDLAKYGSGAVPNPGGGAPGALDGAALQGRGQAPLVQPTKRQRYNPDTGELE